MSIFKKYFNCETVFITYCVFYHNSLLKEEVEQQKTLDGEKKLVLDGERDWKGGMRRRSGKKKGRGRGGSL